MYTQIMANTGTQTTETFRVSVHIPGNEEHACFDGPTYAAAARKAIRWISDCADVESVSKRRNTALGSPNTADWWVY